MSRRQQYRTCFIFCYKLKLALWIFLWNAPLFFEKCDFSKNQFHFATWIQSSVFVFFFHFNHYAYFVNRKSIVNSSIEMGIFLNITHFGATLWFYLKKKVLTLNTMQNFLFEWDTHAHSVWELTNSLNWNEMKWNKC